jgi:hypothetical protein
MLPYMPDYGHGIAAEGMNFANTEQAGNQIGPSKLCGQPSSGG